MDVCMCGNGVTLCVTMLVCSDVCMSSNVCINLYVLCSDVRKAYRKQEEDKLDVVVVVEPEVDFSASDKLDTSASTSRLTASSLYVCAGYVNITTLTIMYISLHTHITTHIIAYPVRIVLNVHLYH